MYKRQEDVLPGVKLTTDGYRVVGNETRTNNVGGYDITFQGNPSKNYKIEQTTKGKLTINPASLKLTADDITTTYGTYKPLTWQAEGLVYGETKENALSGVKLTTDGYLVVGNETRTNDVKSGGYAIGFDGTPTATNYDITTTDGKLTINRASLKLTADDQLLKQAGDTPGPFTYQATGFVYGETRALWGEDAVELTTPYDPDTSETGTYAIHFQKTPALKNYQVTTQDGKLYAGTAPVNTVYNGLLADATNQNPFGRIERLAEKTKNQTVQMKVTNQQQGGADRIVEKYGNIVLEIQNFSEKEKQLSLQLIGQKVEQANQGIDWGGGYKNHLGVNLEINQVNNQANTSEIGTQNQQQSGTRGDLGSAPNRLEAVINNLGVTEETLTAAEHRIRDVDMAQEMLNYTRNNILVQASTAMLAQETTTGKVIRVTDLDE